MLTVKQLVEKYPCFTYGGIRYYLFHSKSNGLEDSGSVIRLGRKILLNEDKFLKWVESYAKPNIR